MECYKTFVHILYTGHVNLCEYKIIKLIDNFVQYVGYGNNKNKIKQKAIQYIIFN